MEEANQINPGRMTALHRFESEAEIRSLCSSTDTYIANLNGPLQIIISGGQTQMDDAEARAKKAEMKVIPLKVSCAAHSPLMEPARVKFEKDLAEAKIRMPDIPVISNVTAQPYESVEGIRAGLSEQLTEPVQWDKSVRYVLTRGIDIFLEYGPDSVLTNLLKWINREVRGLWIGDYGSAQALSKFLNLTPASC